MQTHRSGWMDIFVPGSTVEECGAQVRWCDGKLEQVWTIKRVGATGAIEKIEHEWRIVPTVP